MASDFIGDDTFEIKIPDGNTPEGNTPIVTDIIVILDMSGSMQTMDNEPVESVNAFMTKQDNNSTFTLVTFNTEYERVIDGELLSTVTPFDQSEYTPNGGTALNDAVCSTINTGLESNKPNDKVVVIITDGQENSSQTYSTFDTKECIQNAEINHNWKFIFLGANIDAFSSVNNVRCGQFASNHPGDLLQMCRQTSSNIDEFRRARTVGYNVPELVAAPRILSDPTDLRSYAQSPEPTYYPIFSGDRHFC